MTIHGRLSSPRLGVRDGMIKGTQLNDPARCVNTMCAGPRRTGLEFD